MRNATTRNLLAGLLALGLALAGPAIADEFVIDENAGAVYDAILDGFPFPPPGAPLDGTPDFGNNTLAVSLQSGVTEERAIAEFPLSSLAGLTSADIAVATLTFNIDDVISTFGPGTAFDGTAAASFVLFSFSGDGTVSLTDFNNVVGAPLATVGTTSHGTITDASLGVSGPLVFQVDVTDALSALLDASASHIGIVWTTADAGSATSIDDLGVAGAAMPFLTVTTAVLAPPVLSKEALNCQKAIGKAAGGLAAVVQKNVAGCFDAVLAATAKAQDLAKATVKCHRALDPADPTSKVAKSIAKLSSAVASKCATTTPAELGNPCDAGATDMAAVADCIAAQHRARAQSIAAAEYAASCALITAVGLEGDYPDLCTGP